MLLFFSSYTVVVGIILFNIIVAVLLEGFLGAIQQQDRDERDKVCPPHTSPPRPPPRGPHT